MKRAKTSRTQLRDKVEPSTQSRLLGLERRLFGASDRDVQRFGHHVVQRYLLQRYEKDHVQGASPIGVILSRGRIRIFDLMFRSRNLGFVTCALRFTCEDILGNVSMRDTRIHFPGIELQAICQSEWNAGGPEMGPKVFRLFWKVAWLSGFISLPFRVQLPVSGQYIVLSLYESE